MQEDNEQTIWCTGEVKYELGDLSELHRVSNIQERNPFTSVRAESHKIGNLATEIIINLVNQQKPLQQKVVLQCSLVVRQTSGYRRK